MALYYAQAIKLSFGSALAETKAAPHANRHYQKRDFFLLKYPRKKRTEKEVMTERNV